MMKKNLLRAAVLFGSWFASPAGSWACAVCFTGTGDAVTDGFNASVLFLMATPYAVVGAIIGGLLLAYRRAARKRVQAEPELEQFPWMQEDSVR
jgi:hypothetical protein